MDIQPYHGGIYFSVGLMLTMLMYFIASKKENCKNSMGLLWKGITMVDFTLCLVFTISFFNQYKGLYGFQEYQCAHIPLAMLIQKAVLLVLVMFLVAVFRKAVIVHDYYKTLSTSDQVINSRHMKIQLFMLGLVCTITVLMLIAVREIHTMVEICSYNSDMPNETVAFLWIGWLIAAHYFNLTHGYDQSHALFYLEMSTHFIPLIVVYYWLNGFLINAGINGLCNIVMFGCVVLSSFLCFATHPVSTSSSSRSIKTDHGDFENVEFENVKGDMDRFTFIVPDTRSAKDYAGYQNTVTVV